jgi:hypothetical protein
LRGVIYFRNQGKVGMIELLKKASMPEEALDKLDNIQTDYRPVSFVKETGESVWTRSLAETKLRDDLKDLPFIRNGTQTQVFLRGNNRGKKGHKLIIKNGVGGGKQGREVITNMRTNIYTIGNKRAIVRF